MSEKYIKLFYTSLYPSKKFDISSFDYDEAVRNVRITYNDFTEWLQKENQLITAIDERCIYDFMLYMCYDTFAYPIKVVYSPSLYLWLVGRYNPNKITEIDFRTMFDGKVVHSVLTTNNSYDRMMFEKIIGKIKSLSVDDFLKEGKLSYEIVNAKDYLYKANTRNYNSTIVYRLFRLFSLIFKKEIEEKYPSVCYEGYKNSYIDRYKRMDILNIMKGFKLMKEKASSNDLSKILTDTKSSLSWEVLDRERIYLSNGIDTTLYALPPEIEKVLIEV